MRTLQSCSPLYFFFFFFNDTATTEIYTLSLHDALPIFIELAHHRRADRPQHRGAAAQVLRHACDEVVRERLHGDVAARAVAPQERRPLAPGDRVERADRPSCGRAPGELRGTENRGVLRLIGVHAPRGIHVVRRLRRAGRAAGGETTRARAHTAAGTR